MLNAKWPMINVKRGMPRIYALATRARSTREQVNVVRGQSLFEVIFAVGIAAIILVGVVSLAATSIRNSDFSRNNALATKFAQEGVEWTRQQRDTSWSSFYVVVSVAPGTPKNFGALNWPPSGSCNITLTPFCRTLTFTAVTTQSVDALVVVSWTDAQGTHSVRAPTRFTDWNR